MLRSKVFPWVRRHFGGQIWTFLQDGAPARKAEATQALIAENCPDTSQSTSTRSGDWPPNSPDLNAMDLEASWRRIHFPYVQWKRNKLFIEGYKINITLIS